MLSLGHNKTIYVYRGIVDMRCGRYRLASLVQNELGNVPTGGDYFVFFNRRRTSVKVLYFDKSGYALWYKVLEKGTYPFVSKGILSVAEMHCILEGIEVKKSRKREYFSLPKH